MTPTSELTVAAETVLHVAEHFERLKQRADELVDDFSADSRGLFTPTEDERVRQLLVSYWHSRNALFEIVLENRHYSDAADAEEKSLRFLIAFAGALVLIDASRFLRERVHDRPVVRRKLNEPEPTLGIPQGVYDRVRKSLTSPVHAWHLLHALKYFKESVRQLRGLAASDTRFNALFDLIVRLRHRLDVGVDDFVKARARARVREATTRVRRDLLFRAMYGLQKAISHFLSEKYVQSGHTPRLPCSIVDQLRSQLRPGDVLITRKEFALTNYFIPGFWPHAALYVGSENELNSFTPDGPSFLRPWLAGFRECGPTDDGRVVEALKDGVRLRPITTPLSCDAIAVVRPQLTKDQIADGLTRGFGCVGRPYDFDFDLSRSDRLFRGRLPILRGHRRTGVCAGAPRRAVDVLAGGPAANVARRAGIPDNWCIRAGLHDRLSTGRRRRQPCGTDASQGRLIALRATCRRSSIARFLRLFLLRCRQPIERQAEHQQSQRDQSDR